MMTLIFQSLPLGHEFRMLKRTHSFVPIKVTVS